MFLHTYLIVDGRTLNLPMLVAEALLLRVDIMVGYKSKGPLKCWFVDKFLVT